MPSSLFNNKNNNNKLNSIREFLFNSLCISSWTFGILCCIALSCEITHTKVSLPVRNLLNSIVKISLPTLLTSSVTLLLLEMSQAARNVLFNTTPTFQNFSHHQVLNNTIPPPNNNSSNNQQQSFHVFVAVDKFKFNASHFIAYHGFRERLHGHNYRVSLRLFGGEQINEDGYVMDFGKIKSVVASVCKELNEHFILPCHSNVLTITTKNSNNTIHIDCEDGTTFCFPKDDVILLPIVHSSAEEIAQYLWTRIIEEFGRVELQRRGIVEMEVLVAEAEYQEASFRRRLEVIGNEENNVTTSTTDEPTTPPPIVVGKDSTNGNGWQFLSSQ
jgi:6-pyruvoyl-tetrahydropterin synthase